MVRALPFLAALLLGACSGSTTPLPNPPSCSALGTRTRSAAVALSELPVTVELVLAVTCTGDLGEVQVLVTDPQGLEVPATVGPPEKLTAGLTAAVTFTPVRSGFHRITGRFQPNLGTAQTDSFVVQRVGGPAISVHAPELATCNHLELFDGGHVACLDQGVVVFDIRNHALVDRQELSTQTAARAGDVLWVVGADWSLSRWREGRPFTREPDVAAILPGPVNVLLPAEDDVIALTLSQGLAPRVSYVRPAADGGISREAIDIQLDVDPLGAWRTGAQFGTLTVDRECSTRLDAGVSCSFLLPGGYDVVGHGDDGVWVTEPAAFSTAKLSVRRGGSERGSLSVGSVSGPDLAYGASPSLVFGAARYPLRMGDGEIVAESYGDEADGQIISVTSSAVARFNDATQTLTLYPR